MMAGLGGRSDDHKREGLGERREEGSASESLGEGFTVRGSAEDGSSELGMPVTVTVGCAVARSRPSKPGRHGWARAPAAAAAARVGRAAGPRQSGRHCLARQGGPEMKFELPVKSHGCRLKSCGGPPPHHGRGGCCHSVTEPECHCHTDGRKLSIATEMRMPLGLCQESADSESAGDSPADSDPDGAGAAGTIMIKGSE
jgi:hypothetical protein